MNDMKLLFESCFVFKQKRDTYLQKYQDRVNQKNAKEKQLEENHRHKLYSSHPIPDDLLNEFGLNIEQEYNLIPKNEIDNCFQNGIPFFFFNLELDKYFDYGGKQKKLKEDENEKRKQERKQQKQLDKLNNPGKNCQKRYYNCIKKIKSFGIDIYGVEKDLKKFQNREVSSMCAETLVYKFHCKKNNYVFKIDFVDDCECYPGMLLVRKVTDINTDLEIESYCDLFCQNTGWLALENFLDLIQSISFDDYFEKKFGHFFRLPKLLDNLAFKVSSSYQFPKEKSMTTNNHYLGFDVQVTNDKGSCILIPHVKNGHSNAYVIYVCPTLQEINQQRNNKLICDSDYQYCTSAFIFDVKPRSFELEYYSDDDLQKLVECINLYIDYKNGQYGYFDPINKVFRNENDVETYIKGLMKNDPKQKITFLKNSNDNYGRDFDVFIMYYPGDFSQAVSFDHFNDIEYPLDFYGIRFWYDKRKNVEKCFLTIQSKYINLTQIATDYYSDEEKYRSGTFDLNPNEIQQKLLFEGTFDQCFSQLKNFIEKLIQINE